ncbi:MAG: amino acid adenylation domain-containing protein [Actinobacteria bacterium]|nr:amino acid adenylation domain-containing protein [Actinomycetota bacterium]
MTDGTIHGRVAEQVARRGGATALCYPGGRLSYAELDRRSGRIASELRAAGVGPGTVVPVLLPPSPELAVALLAVLRCGAAYAALDLGWPPARIERIGSVLAGQLAIAGPVGPDLPWRRAVLSPDGTLRVDPGPAPARLIEADGRAAMVFFTSGSTGEPKAVLSPHRATLRLFDGCTFATFDAGTVMAQIAAVPWDAFAMELWGPLVTGGTSALVTERPVTPASLRTVIAEHGVNTLFLTTSMFHLVVEEDVDAFASLHTLIAGGEKMSPSHAAAVLRRWPELRLVNGYGPVESAVFVLTRDVLPADTAGDIPLGRPVPHTDIVIMRRDGDFGRPCPDGEAGEICIAGDGLALGYLGNDALTADRFPTVLLDGRPRRLYRTGDLGSRDPDGTHHFRGRLDRQVKVRGNRVEPTEIEAAAAAVPGVRRSLVVPEYDANGNAVSLVLCYVGSPEPAAVGAALRGTLPGYAVPDRIHAVETFPLAATGKVDAAALLRSLPGSGATAGAAPGSGATAGAAPVAEPATGDDPLAMVAAEAAALLRLPAIDPSTSLFSLGATSLTAVRLCSRLSSRLGRPIPVSRFLHDPTVGGLARWLAGGEPAPAPDEPAGDSEPGAALTAMQSSFVLSHLRSGADTGNHCLLGWRIAGPVDQAALAGAVAEVHGRHGYLSGRYLLGEELRLLPGDAPPPLETLTAAAERQATELLRDRLRKPFDLAAGEVWRAVLVDFGERERWLLGVAVHHAAFDGWSEHLLADELSRTYAGALGAASKTGANPTSAAETDVDKTEADKTEADKTGAGPDQPVPTPDEVFRLLRELGSAADLDRQREYWRQALAGLPSMTWPADPSASPATGIEDQQRVLEVVLADEVLAAAEAAARRHGTTLLSVLLAAVGDAVRAQTGQDDFGVGVPVSQRGSEELQRPIGCLIDTVCVRLRAGDDVPTAVESAIANADLPFAEVVRLLRPKRTGRHPLYQVIAAVQDSPLPELELTGCRAEPLADTEVLWPDAELVVELFTAAGAPARLRVSRDPDRVDRPTFERLARDVHDRLAAPATFSER